MTKHPYNRTRISQLQCLCSLVIVGMGCQEHKVTAFNSEPVASISSHRDGDFLVEGTPVKFRGLVSDDDDGVDELETTWRIGDRAVCTEIVPDMDGATECEITLESTDLTGDMDVVSISLTVSDPRSANHTARIDLDAHPNIPPVVEILSPEDDARYYADEPVTFHGVVSDNEDHPTELTVWWESSLEPELPFETEANDEGTILNTSFLAEGQHTITLMAEDRGGRDASKSVTILVKSENRSPTCSITSPSDGAVFDEDATVNLAGIATDPDITPPELTATWTSDLDGILNEAPPAADGTLAVAVEELTPGDHNISLAIVDDRGLACADTVLLSVRARPTIEEFEPAEGTVVTEGEDVDLEVVVSDLEDPLTLLQVGWASDRDGTLGTATADTLGRASIVATDLAAGTHSITASVTDSDGMTGTTSFSIVVNQPPTRPDVSLSPSPASTTDDLLATIDSESIDPEGSSISYTYAWSRDGEASLFSTTDRLDSSATSKGQRWTIEVTPNDGHTDGPPATSTVDILNTAPTVSTVVVTPSSPATSSTLTCSGSGTADADGDDISLSYIWLVNDSPVGAESTTLSPDAFVAGDLITCEAQPYDGEVLGSAVASAPVKINVPPVVHSVYISPTSATGADPVTCNVGSTTDLDDDPIEVAIGWFINDIELAESGTTLDSSYFVRDDEIVCTATANDGIEDGEVAISEPIIISNTVPVVTSASIEPSEPVSTDTLLCTASGASDGDDDPVTVQIGWIINGAEAGPTGETLSPIDFEPGDIIECEATPQDDLDTGEPVRSASVQINVPPVVHSVHVSPIDPTVEDVVSCNEGAVSDGDLDPVSTTIRWFINGIDIGLDGTTLDGGWFARDDEIHCAVTPYDGAEYGTELAAEPVTVQNAIPQVVSVEISPMEARTSSILTVSVDANDADIDALSTHYQWTVNGEPAGTDTDSLDGAVHFGRDDTVAVTVTAHDGIDTSAPMTTAGVVIENTPPSAPSVAIEPTEPAAGQDDLVCSLATPATDEDGDVLIYTFSWTKDGIPFESSTDSTHTDDTIPGFETSADEVWACTVIASDGTDEADATSASVVPEWRYTGWGDEPFDLIEASAHLYGTRSTEQAGTSLANAGDLDGDGMTDLMVGAQYNDDFTTNSGKAYIALSSHYMGSSAALLEDAYRIIEGDQSNSGLGKGLAGGGNVGGGEAPDFAVGAHNYDLFESDAGVVGIFFDGGEASEDPVHIDSADALLYGATDGEQAGYDIHFTTDMDEDGRNELLVGAPRYDGPGAWSGAVYLVLGSAIEVGGSIDLDDSTRIIGESGLDRAGDVVRPAGDLDGDGISDILISAPSNEEGGAKAGRVYIISGDAALTFPTLLLADADHKFHGENAHDQAGFSLDGNFDVDGDGIADILVGAPFNDTLENESGRAYMILGERLPTIDFISLAEADITFTCDENDAQLGTSVSAASDVDNDGLADVIIGIPNSHAGSTDGGAAALFQGEFLAAGGVFTVEDSSALFYGLGVNDHAGQTVLGLGDVDGDTFGDLAIAEPNDGTLGGNAGLVHILFTP